MAISEKVDGNLSNSGRENEEIDLLELIGVLFRYKWMMIILTTLAAIGVLVYSVISIKLPPEKSYLPNVFTPTALVLINQEDSGGVSSVLASSGLANLAGLVGASTGSSYGSLAEKLITARTTLDKVANEFQLAERYRVTSNIVGNSRRALLEHLSVSFDAETGILTIGYEDYDPELAKQIVNRFVELLDERFASIGGNKNLIQKQLLEVKLAEVEAEIGALETEITIFQKKHGALDVESLAKEQVTAIAGLKSQLILRDLEMKTYTGFALLDDPVLKRMRAERDNLATLISEMESGYSQYEAFMPTQKDLPALAIEFEHLKRNLEIQATIYQLLTQQYELAKLNVEGEKAIFQVLETAEAPDLKSGPNRSILCIVVTLAAFFFSIILAFVLNALRNIRNDPERMRKLRGI
jgi:tyrosine-protein kinase Etk/Wzc